MKVAFILLSILSAVLTWWWYSRPRYQHDAGQRTHFFRRLTHSLIAGVAVYFSLMAVAMMWLLITT